MQVRYSNNEILNEFDTMNYVGEESDIICSVIGKLYNVFQDKMKQLMLKNVISEDILIVLLLYYCCTSL